MASVRPRPPTRHWAPSWPNSHASVPWACGFPTPRKGLRPALHSGSGSPHWARGPQGPSTQSQVSASGARVHQPMAVGCLRHGSSEGRTHGFWAACVCTSVRPHSDTRGRAALQSSHTAWVPPATPCPSPRSKLRSCHWGSTVRAQDGSGASLPHGREQASRGLRASRMSALLILCSFLVLVSKTCLSFAFSDLSVVKYFALVIRKKKKKTLLPTSHQGRKDPCFPQRELSRATAARSHAGGRCLCREHTDASTDPCPQPSSCPVTHRGPGGLP